MTYTTARFEPPSKEKPKSTTEAIQDTARSSIAAATVADLVIRRKQQHQSDERAKKAVKLLLENLSETESVEASEADSLLMHMVKKVMIFAGRKILQYIVRPVLDFAARVAMNLVRFALRSLVTYIVVPVIEAIVVFAVANPFTAGVIAALAIGGAGYWVWNKFFADNTPPLLPEAAAADVAGSTPAAAEVAESAEAAVSEIPAQELPAQETAVIAELPKNPQAEMPKTKQAEPSNIKALVAHPVDFVKEKYNKLTSKKFTGFGSDVDGYIKEASKLYGLPEDILRGFIKMEGGWTGKMSPTGAIGTGQFIQPTWDAMAATADGQAIGMTKIGKTFRTAEDPRFNKRINTLATALLARDNAKILAANGLPLTGENLYMMHNIGPGIIPVMLGKPASASTLLAMKQNGMLAGQTPEQFLAYQKGRFSAQYRIANTDTKVAPGTTPTFKDGVAVDTPKIAAAIEVPKSTSEKDASKGGKADREIVRGKGKSLIEVS